MCRIAGIYDPHSLTLEQDIHAMTNAMYRGGPDGSGFFVDTQFPLALGHRRLALIDLTNAGNQPMVSADGQVQIVFNGEIYNYRELKQHLAAVGYSFSTQTDTEVILAAYHRWSTDCFERFNGMFAIALWDKRKQQLILARDHAGIKPLYYHAKAGKLIFASEIRAFKAYLPSWPENKDWKIPFLCFGHLPEPFTTLEEVIPLPKGTIRIFQLPSLKATTKTFYSGSFTTEIQDEKSAVSAIRATLEAAVERHLISDAPIGLFLSGGIDSSLLTLIAAQKLPVEQLKTLSLVFEDAQYSEAKYQQIISQKTGIPHQSFVVTEQIFKQSLPDIIEAMDQPSTDGINAYFICKYAHEYGLTAVLSGIGADELLGGYPSFRRGKQLKQLQQLPNFMLAMAEIVPQDRYRKISALQRKDAIGLYLFNRGFFSFRQTASLLDVSEKYVQQVLEEIQKPEIVSIAHPANRIAAIETNMYMQNQLLKDNDSMSMWHSLELRVPFLDKTLMELTNRIDPKIKFNPAQGKHLLIKAFQEVLPEAIWNRPKQGFAFPFHQWMKQLYPLKRNREFRKVGIAFAENKIHWSKYWCYLLLNKEKNLLFHQKQLPTVLFANLTAFSITGGIEKFNRCFLKALHQLEIQEQLVANAKSAYDLQADNTYFPNENYHGFQGNRWQFVWSLVKQSKYYQVVIIGHINMAVAVVLMRLLYGRKQKIILMTHGIEVWRPLSFIAKRCLKCVDEIWSVSNFTKLQLVDKHRIQPGKIDIFPNTIDPFFVFPQSFTKPTYLMERYRITRKNPILFTLTRLSSTEKYKGYDTVIEVVSELKQVYPHLRYLIAGKTDAAEKLRIETLIQQYQVQEQVQLIGFLEETEVTDHYLLADLFIMPSRKEGFGIVFIEAMACGLPVIAGNEDGSVDALKNGELGTLVNPKSKSEIKAAIEAHLQLWENPHKDVTATKLALQQKVRSYFGFDQYKQRLVKLLNT